MWDREGKKTHLLGECLGMAKQSQQHISIGYSIRRKAGIHSIGPTASTSLEDPTPLDRATNSPVDSLAAFNISELKITRRAARGSEHLLGLTVNVLDVIAAIAMPDQRVELRAGRDVHFRKTLTTRRSCSAHASWFGQPLCFIFVYRCWHSRPTNVSTRNSPSTRCKMAKSRRNLPLLPFSRESLQEIP